MVYRVPWELVHGVRVDEDDVLVAWAPDESFTCGPFDDAEQLAGTIAALRERGAAWGQQDRPVAWQFRAGSLVVLGPIAAAALAIGLLALQGH